MVRRSDYKHCSAEFIKITKLKNIRSAVKFHVIDSAHKGTVQLQLKDYNMDIWLFNQL